LAEVLKLIQWVVIDRLLQLIER